jgi:hypothetical protein
MVQRRKGGKNVILRICSLLAVKDGSKGRSVLWNHAIWVHIPDRQLLCAIMGKFLKALSLSSLNCK